MKVTKQTLINKIMDGVYENGWDILISQNRKGTMKDMVEPLVKYLESKGIEVK